MTRTVFLLAGMSLMIPLAVVACGEEMPSPSQDAGSTGADANIVPQPGAAYLFDETQVRTYELTVAPADWQWLQDNARREQYVPATLAFEGQTVNDVAVRYKGAYGSLQNQGPIDDLRPCFDANDRRLLDNCPKLGVKVSFNEYVPDREWYGVRKLQFHAMGSDRTKMVERLGYWLFREMNVFAPRTAHARLVVNGEDQGLYILVEYIDGRFTRARMPDGGRGNLYKEIWPVHTTAAPYLGALRTNEDENPSVDRMIRFATELRAADDTTFEAVLERWMDVDMYMRHMAVARAIEHWDGIIAWYCTGNCFNHNYYWYESTIEDRVWLIPWDLDRAMVWPPPIRTLYGMPEWDEQVPCDPVPLFVPGLEGLPPSCDRFIGATARVLWDRYAQATRELLAGPMDAARIQAKVDEYAAQLDAHVDLDVHLDVTTWRADVEQFRLDLASMRAYIESRTAL